MPSAPFPAGLPSQPPQGPGARLVRRFGRAVRSVIGGGIALAGRLQRPAAPRLSRNPPAPQDPAAPAAPGRSRVPRRKPAAAPVPPPRPARFGWLARWFGPNRPRPASLARPRFPDSNDTPFTPEAYPGLSPEACAMFNTPVEKCDSDLLRLVLAVLAHHIADSIPPELGMDAKALFSTLWGRLATVPGAAGPDAPPAGEPAPAPATPKDAVPDVPPASPTPLLHAQGTEPADDAATAAWDTPPDAASLTGPVFRRGRSLFDGSRSFRHRRRSVVRLCRSRVHRLLPGGPQRLPPPRRLCYAACAGPP